MSIQQTDAQQLRAERLTDEIDGSEDQNARSWTP